MDVHGRRGVVRDLRTLFVSGTIGGLTDVQLLERYLGGNDEGAFEALMARHGAMVWGVCKRLLGNHQDAEDAFQATFLILARKAASVHPRDLLANWLYGVAYRTALKARATRLKRDARERTVDPLPEPFNVPKRDGHDLSDQLDRELTRLPEKYRVPIILCDLEEKSHKDAAILLGWPIGTVSGRLSRGRTLLAKRLKREPLAPSASVTAFMISQSPLVTSLPYRLVESTSKAAGLIALGRSATLGVVSTHVAVLTEGVLKSMLMTKIKIATAVAVSGFALFAGGNGISLIAKAAPGPWQDSGQNAPVSKPSSADSSIIEERDENVPRSNSDDAKPAKPRSASEDSPVEAKPAVLGDNVRRDDANQADRPAKVVSQDVAAEATEDQPPAKASSNTRLPEKSPRNSSELPPSDSRSLPPFPDPGAIVFPDEVEWKRLATQRLNLNRYKEPPGVELAGTSDDLEDVELAIAQGVMEAQKLSEGKNAKEVNRLAEDMNKMLQAERLKIRRIEACLRRLTRIRDKKNPRPGGATQFEGKPRSESKPAVLER